MDKAMDGGKWEEAQVGQQLPLPTSETDLTTDDLVFMIGEAAVQKKGQDKIIKFQNKVIQALHTELAKAQSLAAGKETLLGEIEAAKKSSDGKDIYIKQLETGSHAIALERDNLKKEKAQMQVEIESLNMKKTVKRVK